VHPIFSLLSFQPTGDEREALIQRASKSYDLFKESRLIPDIIGKPMWKGARNPQ
jgi:hypothetical protein